MKKLIVKFQIPVYIKLFYGSLALIIGNLPYMDQLIPPTPLPGDFLVSLGISLYIILNWYLDIKILWFIFCAF